MPKANSIPARTPIVNLLKPDVTSLGDAGEQMTGRGRFPLHCFPTDAKAGLEVIVG